MMIFIFISGFIAGVIATFLSLHILSITNKKLHEKEKPYKSPYSDINLLDTKFKNCG